MAYEDLTPEQIRMLEGGDEETAPETATAVAEPPAPKQYLLSPDEQARARRVDERRRRMDEQNAQQGYRQTKSSQADIDFQRPNFANNEEYQQFVNDARVTDDLRKRLFAKQQADKGMVLGYSPESLKKLDYLEKAYGKANEEFAQDKMSVAHLQEIHGTLMRQKDSVPQTWNKPPPTLKQQVESELWTDPASGIRYRRDAKTGDLEPLKGLTSAKEKIAIYEAVLKRNEIYDEKTGTITQGDPAKIKADFTAAMRTLAEINNIEGANFPDSMQGQPPPQQGQPRQPPPQLNNGMRQAPPPVESVTWGDLTPEQQTEAVSKHGKEEREKDRRVVQGGQRRITKPMNEQQFLERVKQDPVFLSRYTGDIRKPGAPPPTWDKATEAERRMMYQNYYRSVPEGDETLSEAEFGRKMTKDPSAIQHYFKPKGEKSQGVKGQDRREFVVGQTTIRNGKTWKYIGNGKWSDQ
jgi:hypothetical protein